MLAKIVKFESQTPQHFDMVPSPLHRIVVMGSSGDYIRHSDDNDGVNEVGVRNLK